MEFCIIGDIEVTIRNVKRLCTKSL